MLMPRYKRIRHTSYNILKSYQLIFIQRVLVFQNSFTEKKEE